MSETEVPAPPPPTPGPAEPKPSPYERIVGVISSPTSTLESIARRPDWVVPLVIIMVLSIVGGVLVAGHVDFQAMAREAMEMNPRTAEIPADRVDSAVRFTAGIMKVSAYASPLLSVIVLLIVAGVLLLTFRLFGGEGDFKQAFAVTVYAWYPRVIKGLVGLVVIMSRKSLSVLDLQNPLMSNLGFLFDPKTQILPYTIGTSLDLFTIWSLALLVIGFAAVAKVSRGKASGVVVSWWIVVNLVSLIGPLMQTLRR